MAQLNCTQVVEANSQICSLIVCTHEDLKTSAKWDGARGRSRRLLLQELSSMSKTHEKSSVLRSSSRVNLAISDDP